MRVRSEIVNSVLAKLQKVYGKASNPGMNFYCLTFPSSIAKML